MVYAEKIYPHPPPFQLQSADTHTGPFIYPFFLTLIARIIGEISI
jgi:hypothetical protein